MINFAINKWISRIWYPRDRDEEANILLDKSSLKNPLINSDDIEDLSSSHDKTIQSQLYVNIIHCFKTYATFIICIRNLLLFILVLFILYIFGTILYVNEYNSVTGKSSPQPLEGIKITMLGDSLVHRPHIQYKFFDMIKNYMNSDQSLILYDEGGNGNTIHDIYSRLDNALRHQSQGLILQWDSDVSDIDESVMTTTQIIHLRQSYEHTLKSTIQRIHATNHTDIIAISGPGVLGEQGIMTLFLSGRFRGKESMLNDYRDINKRVAAMYNIPYIDIRSAFQNVIPYWFWIYGRWYVTTDGEHFNGKGKSHSQSHSYDTFLSI